MIHETDIKRLKGIEAPRYARSRPRLAWRVLSDLWGRVVGAAGSLSLSDLKIETGRVSSREDRGDER